MFRTIYKSKIQGAIVTEANLEYVGSVTIDEDLMVAADIIPNERVQVVNLNNGSRIETYVIPGKKGSGVICMNGGAARWALAGDRILVISYAMMDDKDAAAFKPKVIFVDNKNKITGKK
ncbi:MAG: aspartate 1-decarboxylase [Candidatus Omnitrophota bacterium]|nr:aspartate 1-decarboxylase [Candidatus Omnitrophota bacterium]